MAGRPFLYKHYNYCADCQTKHPKIMVRCPHCNQRLRTKTHWKKTKPEETKKQAKNYLQPLRGYSNPWEMFHHEMAIRMIVRGEFK